MTNRKRQEAELAGELERNFDNPGEWSDPIERPKMTRKTLATHVTVRLSPEDAELLRTLAAERNVGYSSLVREIVTTRLRESVARRDVRITQLQWTPAGGSGGSEGIQISGSGRLLKAV